MTIQIRVQKETGAVETPTLPVFVWQDTLADLSLIDAITAVDAAFGTTIPSTVLGLSNDGNPGTRRLSKSSFEFTINYRLDTNKPSKPPSVGEFRSGFNWHAPRKWVQFAPQVASFPGGSPPSLDVVNQIVDANGFPTNSGVWLEPPVPNLTKTFSVDPATVTGPWVRTLAALMGHVNSASLTSAAYAIGEICLVQAVGSLISNEAFHVDIGWNWAPNVSSENRGTVTGVNRNGQDYVWDFLVPFTDRSNVRLGWQIKHTYVHRVRQYSDLSAIGVQPP